MVSSSFIFDFGDERNLSPGIDAFVLTFLFIYDHNRKIFNARRNVNNLEPTFLFAGTYLIYFVTAIFQRPVLVLSAKTQPKSMALLHSASIAAPVLVLPRTYKYHQKANNLR